MRGRGKKKNCTQKDMAFLLERSGIFLSKAQLEQLWSYHTLLRRYNPELNLTRVRNFENMVLKLYADSILPGLMTTLPSPLLDIGTGPGMPGIPLKIAFPDLEVILAESRQKRAGFLEKAVNELSLEGVSVIGRAVTPKFREPVQGVITRAVESIEDTLLRIKGCLVEGGLALFMKGPGCGEEISAAGQRLAGSYELIEDSAYRIPHTPHERRLVIFRRTSGPECGLRQRTADMRVFKRIESPGNDTFKALKKLLSGKGSRKAQKALVSGSKLVEEFTRDFPGLCEAWISDNTHPPPPEESPLSMAWYQFSCGLFKSLDVNGTRSPLVLASVPRIRKWRQEDGFAEGCSLLLPFQDPENVGAVIRSAVAFNIRRIILLSECAYPFHPKAVRSSGGAVFYAEFFQGPSIADLTSGLEVITLSVEGEPISEAVFPGAFGLLPGVEGGGLPEHLRRNSVSIPVSQDVESLNAAAAAAIAMYEYAQKSRGSKP